MKPRKSYPILVGFAGAFRRSELVALTFAAVQFTYDGVVVTLPRSKTDQEGAGATKGIPYGSTPATCPIRALRAWLDAADIAEGPIFRPINRWGQIQPKPLTGHAVAEVVKQLAERAGYDPASFSGHSLRAGLATAAYRWRKTYGAMSVSEAQRLKELEKENARLKRLLAERMLEVDALKDLLGKKHECHATTGGGARPGDAWLVGAVCLRAGATPARELPRRLEYQTPSEFKRAWLEAQANQQDSHIPT